MSGAPYDPAAFRQFEHDGWQRLSQGYHRHWEALTTQAVPRLLAATEVSKGMHVLDAACGPGYVSGAAAAWGAATVGIDFSENMIAVARSIFPELDFRVADAEDLPFADHSFDAVLINYGVLHFPDPDKALAEAHRVLKQGGRLAFTSWAPSEDSAISIAMNAIAKAGSFEVDLPTGTPLYRFADHADCQTTLSAIGFEEIVCTDLVFAWRLPRPDALMETFRQATARMSGLLNAQSPEALPAISAAMAEACAPYDQGDVTLLRMPAVLTSAVKA